MLRLIIDKLVYGLLRLPPGSRLAAALDFFLYDSVKIIVLLALMIAVIGFLRTYLPQERMRYWLRQKGVWGNIAAAAFGAVTPFCSCSSIPIFLSFLEAGVPLGVAFSFLITSPLINEYLAVLMVSFFGWKIAVAYIVSGLLIGIVAGIILGKMGLERYLEKDLLGPPEGTVDGRDYAGLRARIKFGIKEAGQIVGKLWRWVLAGVALGAVIHNYVPDQLVQGMIAKTGFLSVPLAVALGVPMYASCLAIVPVAVVLFQKGIPLGTALAFMMATAALSLPEAVMLRRAMRLNLIAVFFGVTTLGIIFTGYCFNFLQPLLR